jgi:AcrR family transcriptional regulator
MMGRTSRPRGRPRGFDPDEVLDRVIPVFWAHGYDGASVEELTAASGLARPSLYAAFGDKRGLFLAALDRYAATLGRGPVDRLAEAEVPDAGIRAFLDATVDLVAGEAGRPHGCLLACAAADAAECDARVRERLAAMTAATEAAIATRAAAWCAAGARLPFPGPDELGAVLVTLMQGLAVRARAGAARPDLQRIIASALALFDAPPPRS